MTIINRWWLSSTVNDHHLVLRTITHHWWLSVTNENYRPPLMTIINHLWLSPTGDVYHLPLSTLTHLWWRSPTTDDFHPTLMTITYHCWLSSQISQSTIVNLLYDARQLICWCLVGVTLVRWLTYIEPTTLFGYITVAFPVVDCHPALSAYSLLVTYRIDQYRGLWVIAIRD